MDLEPILDFCRGCGVDVHRVEAAVQAHAAKLAELQDLAKAREPTGRGWRVDLELLDDRIEARRSAGEPVDDLIDERGRVLERIEAEEKQKQLLSERYSELLDEANELLNVKHEEAGQATLRAHECLRGEVHGILLAQPHVYVNLPGEIPVAVVELAQKAQKAVEMEGETRLTSGSTKHFKRRADVNLPDLFEGLPAELARAAALRCRGKVG